MFGPIHGWEKKSTPSNETIGLILCRLLYDVQQRMFIVELSPTLGLCDLASE